MPTQMTKEESAGFLNGAAPAFAIPHLFGPNGEALCEGTPGLTKREYIAALAMQGMIANGMMSPAVAERMMDGAVLIADALLAELAKQS